MLAVCRRPFVAAEHQLTAKPYAGFVGVDDAHDGIGEFRRDLLLEFCRRPHHCGKPGNLCHMRILHRPRLRGRVAPSRSDESLLCQLIAIEKWANPVLGLRTSDVRFARCGVPTQPALRSTW